MTSPRTLLRLPYLDALRGLAILVVLAFHTTTYGTNIYPGWFSAVISQGARGVQLFFVVSAVTLCLSLYERRKEPHSLRSFFIRRFFRIMPLFYVALIYYLMQAWLSGGQVYSLTNIISTMTFVNVWSPYWINNIVIGGWSIPVEMGFYLILPFVFRWQGLAKKLVLCLFGAMALGQLIRLYLLQSPLISDFKVWQEFTFLSLPSQLPVFLFGVWAYFLVFRFEKKQRWQQLLGVTGMCVAMAVVQRALPFKLVAGHYLWALGFVWLIVGLAHQPVRLIVNAFTTYLGKISYSVYLCHFAVMFWLSQAQLVDLIQTQPLLSYCLRFTLVLLCSIIVASLLYQGIERPGQTLGKNLIMFFNRREKEDKP